MRRYSNRRSTMEDFFLINLDQFMLIMTAAVFFGVIFVIVNNLVDSEGTITVREDSVTFEDPSNINSLNKIIEKNIYETMENDVRKKTDFKKLIKNKLYLFIDSENDKFIFYKSVILNKKVRLIQVTYSYKRKRIKAIAMNEELVSQRELSDRTKERIWHIMFD